jgi:hypothetical protein
MAGETKAVLTAYQKPRKQLANGGLCVQMFEVPLATGEMELNDVVNLGYLPDGVTVVAVGCTSDDLDSSTGVVTKVTIGATDVLTGVTSAVLGSVATQVPTVRAIKPYVTSGKTLASTTFTTAPSGTAAAGSLYYSFWYYS